MFAGILLEGLVAKLFRQHSVVESLVQGLALEVCSKHGSVFRYRSICRERTVRFEFIYIAELVKVHPDVVATICWPSLMEEQRADADLFVSVLSIWRIDIDEEVRLELLGSEVPVVEPVWIPVFNALFQIVKRSCAADVERAGTEARSLVLLLEVLKVRSESELPLQGCLHSDDLFADGDGEPPADVLGVSVASELVFRLVPVELDVRAQLGLGVDVHVESQLGR